MRITRSAVVSASMIDLSERAKSFTLLFRTSGSDQSSVASKVDLVLTGRGHRLTLDTGTGDTAAIPGSASPRRPTAWPKNMLRPQTR